MKAIVEKPFSGAPDGELHPRAFAVGDTVTGDLAVVAVREKWAVEEKPEKVEVSERPGRKARGNAPENKDAGAAPENKGGKALFDN